MGMIEVCGTQSHAKRSPRSSRREHAFRPGDPCLRYERHEMPGLGGEATPGADKVRALATRRA
jgi:hypothetical protein